MRRSRQVRRAINQLPLGLRLVLMIVLLIAAAISAWRGDSEPQASSHSAPSKRATGPVVGLSGVASVIDGDTLEVHGQRIRLHGIDAPEGRQNCTRNGENWRCGQAASIALSDYIGRQPIACEQRDVDRYKRIVAICRLDGLDINEWLVRNGWAMAYRQYSKDYIGVEAIARAARLGIWSGEVQPPWEWRRKPKS